MSQIHSSYFQPRIYPRNNDCEPAEIDRAQTIDPSGTTNWEKVEEIGREGIVGHLKKIPTVGYKLTQNEYGSFEFWRKITNSPDATLSVDLNDFKTAAFDIAAFLTDDDAAFVGTMVYPNLRTAGFTVNIADPDALIERTFDFVGEQAVTWQGDNQYYIYDEHVATSGADTDIDLTSIPPARDPDSEYVDVFFVRVLRIRSGVTTELTENGAGVLGYTYSDVSHILQITSITTGDIIKSYYTSATAPAVIFTDNDTDVAGILADSAEIYLYIPQSGSPSSSDYLYRIQSVSLDVRFEREDVKEIGNREVVKRGIKDKTVTVTLGRILNNFTVEEVLRGVAADYGKIDIDKLSDEAVLLVKIFEDYTKTTFKYGFMATGLAPTDLKPGAAINEYVKADATLEGEYLLITTTEGDLV